MSRLEGGCACGSVRYRLTAAPLFVHCCHCPNCQRQTGSAFVVNALIEAGCVEVVSGEPVAVDVARDEGPPQRIWRCPECQVAIYSRYSRDEFRYVRGGTLDEPSRVRPDVHIYTRSKLPWVVLPDGVPAFEEFYDDMQALWPASSLERFAAATASS
jgi:hypothetical protein